MMRSKAFILFCLVMGLAGCAASSSRQENIAQINLLDTYWKLVTLGGEAVRENVATREIHMVFEGKEQIRGFAGCNRFVGEYSSQKTALKIGKLAATRMYCENTMQIEDKFIDMLEQVDRYEIKGRMLYLYQKNEIAAVFEAEAI